MFAKLSWTLVAVLAALSCIACGGASGGVDDDPSYVDSVDNNDTSCNEVATADGETQYVCPTGHYFLAGSNPPCIAYVEDDHEVVDQDPCKVFADYAGDWWCSSFSCHIELQAVSPTTCELKSPTCWTAMYGDPTSPPPWTNIQRASFEVQENRNEAVVDESKGASGGVYTCTRM